MSSARLQQHYIRLWQQCQGESRDVTLSQLAEGLSCTRRHMRNLLKAMQQQGWLTWHAEAGRGKRARLEFRLSGMTLQQQRADELLQEGSIDQLVQLVGDKNSVRQMLISHLGRSFRQGRHIFRVLYYRTLLNLLPGSPLRRTEKHLARQIFSGLTRINEENGEIEADIAHHWQQLSSRHWRFYLRPAIRFHHGRELEIGDIIASLTALQNQPLFAHLQHIHSPAPWTLDIVLSEADHWLPYLLGSTSAMILPKEWPSLDNFARRPIGTGPYSVTENHPTQLQIEAFDDYFGYRALVDEVHIWVLPDISKELLFSGVKIQSPVQGETSEESRLEEGGYFVLFDQRSQVAQQYEHRRWLNTLLNPIRLLMLSRTEHQHYWFPAYGVLPCWHHCTPDSPSPKPAALKTLTLTWYSEHSEYQAMANVIVLLLNAHGVEVICQQVDYLTWHQGDVESDIWLANLNFTLPLAFSLFALVYELPLLRHALPLDWQSDAQAWREERLPLAEWHKKIVDERWLHPLFHHWLSLEGERSMRDVRLNTLGWFDFKSAWFAPPEL